MPTITVRLSDDDLQSLKEIGLLRNRNQSDLIREYIQAGIEEEDVEVLAEQAKREQQEKLDSALETLATLRARRAARSDTAGESEGDVQPETDEAEAATS